MDRGIHELSILLYALLPVPLDVPVKWFLSKAEGSFQSTFFLADISLDSVVLSYWLPVYPWYLLG
jgi:hypothetical protein